MASQFSPKRILIVDDNRDAADLTAEILELHGHTAYAAYGGKAGLRAADEHHPDVVLLDIGMPDLDGYAVALELRKMDRLRPLLLIAFTAWGDKETRAKTAAHGFDHHVVKPVSFDTLLDCVLLGGMHEVSNSEPTLRAGPPAIL